MEWTRREFITSVSAAALATAFPLGRAFAQTVSRANTRDRIIFCNEDSNTVSVIDPNTNTVATTINLTSFDEDPRPPFRLATGDVTPTHAAMVTKPLYHGAINIHGATRRRTISCWPAPGGGFPLSVVSCSRATAPRYHSARQGGAPQSC
jgi:YVTN family beta-propeller protein